MAMALTAERGSALAMVATVATAVAVKYRNCRDRQQSIKCGSGSSGDSGRGSGNRGSAAAMAGRGGSTAEVTMMRAAAPATTVVVNLYPLFPCPCQGRVLQN